MPKAKFKINLLLSLGLVIFRTFSMNPSACEIFLSLSKSTYKNIFIVWNCIVTNVNDVPIAKWKSSAFSTIE